MSATATESKIPAFAPEPATTTEPGRVKRKLFRRRGWRAAIWLLVFACGIVVGVMTGRFFRVSPSSPTGELALPVNAQFLKSGPWGRLAKIPLTISAPEEILPIRSTEAAGTHWFFGGFAEADLAKLLDEAKVTTAQRESLMASTKISEVPKGLQVTPSEDILLALAPDARLMIYRTLVRFPENNSQVTCMSASSVAGRLQENDVSPETEALFRKLSCQQDGRLIFSGLASVLAKTADYEEKVRFMKALTMQKTFLLRFHVDSNTDLNAMAAYWSKGMWSSDIKTILSSLARVPGGTWSNALLLIPPLPTAHLYTYPLVADNPLNGAPVIRDCHWTSFNFFRDEPDPKLSNISYIKEKLQESYSPIVGDPRYGDIVFFARPDGTIIHSAVFLADDVVYTKNGDTYIHPWMLSTIPELLDHYSSQLEPGQKLVVTYYRNKYY